MVLRQEVFVVEQNCPFVDADGKDQQSWHLTGYNEGGKLVAYVRLLPEGLAYEGYTSIGRVINCASVRGTGVGKVLMQRSIEETNKLFGKEFPIKIGAQCYLERFYASFGFASQGEPYLEDGIEHLTMVR